MQSSLEAPDTSFVDTSMDIPRTSPGTTIQMNSKDTMDFPGATTTPDVSPPNPDNTASSSNNEKQHLRNHKKGKSKSIKADEPPHVDHNDRISTKHEAKSKRRKSSKKALTDESQRQQFETNVTQENSSYLNQAFFLDQSGATALVQNTTVDFNRSDDFNTSAGEVNSSEVSAASPETPGTKANDSVDAEAEEPVKRKLKPQLTGVESSSRRKSKTRDVRIDASEALGKKSKTLVDGTAGATDPKGSTRRKTKQKPADDGDAEPTYSAPRRKSKAETPAETETKKRKPKKNALDQNSDDNGEPSKDENGEPSKESPVQKSTKSFPESAKEQDRIDYDELSTEPQRQKLKKVCWTCAKHQDPNCNDYEVIPKETSIREAMRLCWECPDPDGDDFGEASPKGKRKCQKFGAMPKPPSLDVDDEYLDELQPEIMESISGINSPEKQLIIDNMLSDVVKASIAKDAMAKFQAIAESVDGFIQDDKSIERSPAGSAMHGFYDDEGTACSHFLNDCSEMTSESGLTSMTSTLPGSSQKSLLPALESELEPLPLYEAYTTSLADVSTTGGTDTTSTLNTEGNTLDGLTLNDSLDRLQVPEPPGSEKGGKHSIPWLNETALQRKSSVERNALKRASTRDLGLESSEPPNRRRSMLGNPVVPGGKGLPDYTRDVSLPADIALLPHVGNRISSTTLTNGLESGSIEADPNSFLYTVSWGAKKFNSVMMLATNNEESYRSLGGKAAKKSRVPLDEISEVDKGSKTTSRLCCLLVFALVVALPSLIIGITIPVLKKRKGCDCDVTVAPTSSPSLSLGGLATLLEQSPADESATFQGEKSPQSKAFDWIVAGSASHSLSTARIVQRYTLATIYFSTGGDSWFVQSGWLSTEDECGWFSSDQEICNPDGELINLSLVYNSLGGMIPKELALLTKLQFLDLTGNSLSGSIPAALGGMSSLGTLQGHFDS
jgi:hypothetical protein